MNLLKSKIPTQNLTLKKNVRKKVKLNEEQKTSNQDQNVKDLNALKDKLAQIVSITTYLVNKCNDFDIFRKTKEELINQLKVEKQLLEKKAEQKQQQQKIEEDKIFSDIEDNQEEQQQQNQIKQEKNASEQSDSDSQEQEDSNEDSDDEDSDDSESYEDESKNEKIKSSQKQIEESSNNSYDQVN
eukprot:TRINITY_DN11210_c0_g1_i3.p1 TRINITY_DN11210_c0_g1~~TRINITY_DN11210_c0_g1_i3.p1  ORF type:complete len:185 (-),score=66.40 TRINITY_DN11210_c0_g1_i3:141-695(-)